MRVTEALLKRKFSRLPLSPEEIKRIPFKELYTLQLKNYVEGKTVKTADVTCLQEMAVMFACMKKYDFREVKCAEEISSFNKCYSEYTANKKSLKAKELTGQLIPGTNARNLTEKQLNQLLAKYPQYNKKLY